MKNEEASPGENRPRGRAWSPEMITASAAVVIGVSALFVSLYETSLIREHQRASVWPHLEGGYSWDGDRFRVLAWNSGVGPARVEQVVLRVDGEPVEDWGEFFGRTGISVGAYVTSQLSGRVLLPGGPLEVLVVEDAEIAASLQARWADVTFVACYCSVFDQCWEADFQAVRTEVRSCTLGRERLFLQ